MYFVLTQTFALTAFKIVFQDGQCNYNPSQRAANCSSYSFVSPGNEDALKQAVANIGPISVAIDATRPSFIMYRSGMIFTLIILNGFKVD